MPELAEVESYKKYLEEAIFESEIKCIQLLSPKVLKTNFETFESSLNGKRFIESRRIGKYLFLKTNAKAWVLLHFGMSGKPVFFRDDSLRPKHSRLVIEFISGLKFAFVCMRMFGKVEWISDIDSYLKIKKIGPDALQVDQKTFNAYLSKRKSAIKTVLLQQEGFAGIGNWIADEMLFQSDIFPKTPSNSLSQNQLSRLFKSMQSILTAAVKVNANLNELPSYFMVKHRWSDQVCPHCGQALNKIVIGGRSSYFCNEKQTLP